MRGKIIQTIKESRLICVVRGVYGDDCLRLAEALCRGGIRLLEVTFNQRSPEEREKTAEAVRRLNEALGGAMFFGAGTVTTDALLAQAKEAGASFIVSPDTNEEIIRLTREQGLVSIPGAMTPTEILRAYNAGADFVKVFPADFLNPTYFKAVHAPLSQIPMLAVGGINQENLPLYLQAGAVGAAVGGVLVNKARIAAGEWDKITESAKELAEAVRRFDESRKE